MIIHSPPTGDHSKITRVTIPVACAAMSRIAVPADTSKENKQ